VPVLCQYTTGMDTEKDAIAILHDAERSLRDLIQKRLSEQRYNDVANIARLADGLSQLTQRGGAIATPPAREQSEVDPPTRVVARSARLATKAPPRKSKATSSKREYPKFVREGDRLVKIGWSKKGRQEYEHRAPKQAVLAFVMHLGRSVPAGKTFAVDEVLPARDSSGEELPSYQVYMTIAWLRDREAIEKRGRDGYIVNHSTLDGSIFDLHWNATPERR